MILLFSVRRDGKSLTEMAKEETGRIGGLVAYAAVIAIIIILLAVVALIVVNALKSSPWGAFTIAMTIPIALLMGVYLRRIRPGKVLEVSVIGFILAMLAIWGGQWVSQNPALAADLHAERDHAGDSDHRLRVCRVCSAGVAAAGATRLSEHFREAGDDCAFERRDRGVASHAAHACVHALRRRHRAGVCRKSVSLCFYHHRLRSDQRIPFPDFERDHSQAHRPRNSDSPGRLGEYLVSRAMSLGVVHWRSENGIR